MEVTPAVKPQSKASASYKPKLGPSSHHSLLVVMEKGALAGICVVPVISLVRVLVWVVLGLFVERCDGVVV